MSATPPPIEKPKSKRQLAREQVQQRKAERAQTKVAEALAKANKAAATATALGRCQQLAKAIPTGFGDWGVVRTQAWEVARARCAEVASFARPHLLKLQMAIGAMERATTAPVERLALDLYGTDEQKAEAAEKDVAHV